MTPNTVIVYRGPSQFTGAPIVAVVTGLSLPCKNPKTGNMLQAWILRDDMDPTTAIRTGADDAICGECALRGQGVHGRTCYVTYWQAPRTIYHALHTRETVDPWVLRDSLKQRWVRLGAYGDPTAAPLPIWAVLLSKAGGWVGYTQQWRVCDPGYRIYLMASVQSAEDQARAVALGWRTYRVRRSTEALVRGEVVCPASREASHALTCQDCGICQGASVQRTNAAIMVHGKPGNLTAFGESTQGRGYGRLRTVPLLLRREHHTGERVDGGA